MEDQRQKKNDGQHVSHSPEQRVFFLGEADLASNQSAYVYGKLTNSGLKRAW